MLPDKLIESIVTAIKSGDFTVLIIAMVIAVIINIRNIIEITAHIKLWRINNINEALSSSTTNGNAKLLYEDELQKEYFHKITGLELSKNMRNYILCLYKISQDELRFRDIKRSIKYMYPDKNIFLIRISIWNHIGQLYNRATAACTFIIGILIMVATVLGKKTTISHFFATFSIGFTILLFSMAMITQCFNVNSAKKVQSFIKHNINNLTNKD
ncbi:MAG: hypothetical protein OEY01_14515 [Desulfobulbaceae bacterium]|nr:hypothetical protein [Desulfobulbaceae bacterium]